MGTDSATLIWLIVVSSVIALTLIVTVGAVLWFHQRRLADQAKAWGRHLLAAQDEERRSIARDLHDDVVQRLSSAQMRLGHNADVEALALLSEVGRDLRNLSRELYPPALNSMPIGDALRDLVTLGPVSIAPVITVECEDGIDLPQPAAVALYRVTQEALHNMQKHSRAQLATLSLTTRAPWVEMSLRDNGAGFDAGRALAHSFGLRSMRERLEAVGGSLTIESAPGKGATVTARVPAP